MVRIACLTKEPFMMTVDYETKVPRSVYMSFLRAGTEARERGQHVLKKSWLTSNVHLVLKK